MIATILPVKVPIAPTKDQPATFFKRREARPLSVVSAAAKHARPLPTNPTVPAKSAPDVVANVDDVDDVELLFDGEDEDIVFECNVIM